MCAVSWLSWYEACLKCHETLRKSHGVYVVYCTVLYLCVCVLCNDLIELILVQAVLKVYAIVL